MTKAKYISTQINELLNNKYTRNCTNKNITFTKECKNEAVRLWEKWLTTKEIFKKLWFPEYILNSRIPINSLNRWRRNNENWNIERKKWKKIWFKIREKINMNNLTDKEKIELLEVEVAYLRELYKQKHWFYP